MYREDDITSDLNEQNMNCYFFFFFNYWLILFTKITPYHTHIFLKIRNYEIIYCYL